MKILFHILFLSILLFSCKSAVDLSKSQDSRIETSDLKTGKIENRELLLTHLDNATGRYINREVPIFINYYPGRDKCNSVIRHSDRHYREANKAKMLNQNEKVEIIRIYKNDKSLVTDDKGITWYKDPNGIIEKTFFTKHYPCGSNVIIAPDGRFISQFGEHSFESIAKNFNKLLYPDAEN